MNTSFLFSLFMVYFFLRYWYNSFSLFSFLVSLPLRRRPHYYIKNGSSSFNLLLYIFFCMNCLLLFVKTLLSTNTQSILDIGKLWLWTKFSPLSVSVHKVLLEIACSFINVVFLFVCFGYCHVTTAELNVTAETKWATKPKIFTIWPLAEVCWPIVYTTTH